MSFGTRVFLLACSATLVLGGLACSGGDDKDAGPKWNFPDSAAFCNGRAQAECSAAIVGVCSPDKDTCIAKAQAACVKELPTKGSYRPVAADACIAAIKSAYSDKELTATEKAAYAKACDPLFGGTGAAGTSCTTSQDCNIDAKLSCDVVKPGETTGSCQVPEVIQKGNSCSEPGQTCETGYYCVSEYGCVERLKVGKECSPTKLCKEDLQCVTASGASTATCEAKTAKNGACTLDAECTDGLCIDVVGGTKQCSPAIYFGPSDPACGRFK